MSYLASVVYAKITRTCHMWLAVLLSSFIVVKTMIWKRPVQCPVYIDTQWHKAKEKAIHKRMFSHISSMVHNISRGGSEWRVSTSKLQWRHNGHDGVANHQPYHCLLHRLFRCRSHKTSKFRVTGLFVENSPVTGEFHAQMASNAENVSICWRHHAVSLIYVPSCAEWTKMIEISPSNHTMIEQILYIYIYIGTVYHNQY